MIIALCCELNSTIVILFIIGSFRIYIQLDGQMFREFIVKQRYSQRLFCIL